MISWDGSYVGNLTYQHFKKCWQVEGSKYDYCTINIDDQEMNGIYIPLKTMEPVLFEHLKPYFQLEPTGHHLMYLYNKRVIVYKVPKEDNTLIWETPLSLVKSSVVRDNKMFISQMRKLLIMYDLLGYSGMSDRGILVRKVGNNYIPVSVNEYKLTTDAQTSSVIKKYMIKEWFTTIDDYKNTVREMFGVQEQRELLDIRKEWLNILEREMKRIDYDNLALINSFDERLVNILASVIE